MPTFFITGIDTDTGKTVATGLMARYLKDRGESVITQKFAQTGCKGISEDILAHRQIMDMEPTKWDKNKQTCPYVFDYPASPHLAAALQNQEIDPDVIHNATKSLEKEFDYLLIEGVGGIYVPINDRISLLDYLEEHKYPLIVVTSSKLGSINHTLLTLEIAMHRNIPVHGLIYNHYPNENQLILDDSINVFKRQLKAMGFSCPIVQMPAFEGDSMPQLDFSPLFPVVD